MIGRIILGLVFCIVGFLMVRKPEIPMDFIGYVNFAERLFTGGSRSFFKLLGVVFILLGFLLITNLQDDFINWVLGFIVGSNAS